MLQLLEDIKVIDYCHSETDRQPRLWIDSGTVSCQKFAPTQEYSKDAFVPLEDWRELSPEEQSLLYASTASKPKDNSHHVGIIKIPESVLEPLEDLGASFIATPQDCQRFTQEPLYPKAIQSIAKFASLLSKDDRPFKIHTITTNPPGLPTVTYDRVRHCYIGLHLDSWDKLSLDKRHLSTNRICINLGLEDRYFLFIDLSLLKMFEFARYGSDNSRESCWEERVLHPSELAQIDPTSIRKLFLERYPNYPVIKVRVSPGEAYIAPTENTIHDASTLGKKFCDVILTIRGHFRLP